jgi:hypothetical protein
LPSLIRATPLRISLLLLLAAVISAGTALAFSNHSPAAGAAQPQFPCVRGMTAAKCRSVLAAAKAAPRSPAVHQGTVTTPLTPEPVTSCGSSFFSPSVWAELTARFGNLSCFRFSGASQWVLTGNGVSTSARSMAPSQGGAIVAVEDCSSASCLSPDATRTFAGFDVARAPDPGSFPLDLESAIGSRFLLFYSADCGPFAFDVATMEWHGGTSADIASLVSHPSSAAAVRAGLLVHGGQALLQARPASDRAACHR